MSRNEDRIIHFSGLEPGVYVYGFVLAKEFFEEWNFDEIEGGSVKVDVEMERGDRQLSLTFRLAGEVTVLCDRCLGEISLPVEGVEHLVVTFSDTDSSDDEELVVLPEKATEIDLSQWLYEYVAIRLPLFRSHPEGECDPETVKFIAQEGQMRPDGETDPRWDALKKLK